ncbi:hypothetical protein D210916BOD24_22090 [Alteromonas sp. D210916BOD_24]|uniref:DUF547 domain-containing protein n=1 Tax=Alteromonas sp. D210916BOD_24 TaxID=3157618 RepID=UPI00399C69D9
MSKLTTLTFVAALSMLPLSNVVAAETLSESFAKTTQNSELEIGYSDLDDFLGITVLDVGRSNREKAPRPSGNTGTRLKKRINRLTALEGNRIYFDNFDNVKYVEALNAIQESLEILPNEASLSQFNSNEQLAYWLNLYNFTLLKEIAAQYPKVDIGKEFSRELKSDFFNDKVLTIEGHSLSLNDIKYDIVLNKYKGREEVIYGFFGGVIGSPSIQTHAFRGKDVWRQLESAAAEFVNSNRGTYYEGRVSALYERYTPFFDGKNKKEAIKDHLLSYLDDEVYSDLANTSADDLEMDIEDFSEASIGNDRVYAAGVSFNNAALIDSARVEQRGGENISNFGVQNFVAEGLISKAKLNVRFTADELELLQGINKKYQVTNGQVTIKDIDAPNNQENQQ